MQALVSADKKCITNYISETIILAINSSNQNATLTAAGVVDVGKFKLPLQ